MAVPTYQIGDLVIYRKGKFSTHPGPRAQDVHPSNFGEEYSYYVDKFWTVAEVREDGTLVVQTRTGKRHELHATDPNLHPASWWTRFWHRDRFPNLSETLSSS